MSMSHRVEFQERFPNGRLVVCSGQTLTTSVLDEIHENGGEYLRKPFSMDHFVQVIQAKQKRRS